MANDRICVCSWSLLFAVLSVGCGDDTSDESNDTENVESFSTTFPPVTTTSGSTTGMDTEATSAAETTSDPTTTTATATTGTDGGTSDVSDTDAASTGAAGDPLSVYDDEFDDATTLPNWILKHEAEGLPPDHSLLDISETEDGKLTVRPVAGGWFDDTTGFLMYVELDENFLVETHVNAGSLVSSASPPTRPYNSGGLLVRSPTFGPGVHNWVTHNVGFQLESVATEGKSTTNSVSDLELIDGPNAGILRMCKVGPQIVLTRQLDGETEFTQTHTYNRGDLTGTMQVGLAVGGWNSTGSAPNLAVTPDIEARFDYIRFRSIDSVDACLDP